MVAWFKKRKPASRDYYRVLAQIHNFLLPESYVEIGVRHGESMALAKSAVASVGIDPQPDLRFPLPGSVCVFPMTSDAFFEQHDLQAELGGRKVDLAFVDGMHLFEFALRDFINLEKCCRGDSTILVHDCRPVDRETAARERTTQLWSGDVWKLIVCLKKYRTDLTIRTIDASPTGLAVISHLDPSSNILTGMLESLYKEFVPYDYSNIEHNKSEQLNLVNNSPNEIQSVLTHRARS